MNKDYLEQARLVLRVLPLIKRYEHFCLKGGTALNFFVQELPRLSVDIDLAYIPSNNRDTALTEITTSMESLKREVERRFDMSRVIVKRAEGYIRGLLINTGGYSIKVEPNPVIRGTVFKPETRSLVSAAVDLFEAELDFQTSSIPDLYGGKVCAAIDRQHPRDLFDIMLMLETEGFTEEIKQAFIVYLLSHPRPILEVLNPSKLDISDVFEKEFKNMTDRTVTLEELESVREELIGTILTSLTKEDKRFILSFKSGEPQWEIHPCPHLKELPAIRWKLANIKQMKKPKWEEAFKKLQAFLYR